MSDTIQYRLPNTSAIIAQSGQFELLQNGRIPSGFVVSDFLHQRMYQFHPNSIDSVQEWNIDEQQPVVISKRDYQIEAQALLNGFSIMQIEKAVYSRVKSVSFSIESALDLFQELEKTYPTTFVYLISSKLFGTWVGATPETLIETEGSQLKTIALAGTQRLGETTEWSQKDREEHEFVVKAIEENLKRNNCSDFLIDGPHLRLAGPVQHLQTDFKAQLGSIPAWNIAMDLHPTPAVCGTPRMAALDLITSREMHDRFLYTGIIGLYSTVKSHLFVNLRCAQLQQDKAYLYLGGGFTIDSIPDSEWEETENKSKTLLNCIDRVTK